MLTVDFNVKKIRQSWSKFNLYNLSRFRNPSTVNRTFSSKNGQQNLLREHTMGNKYEKANGLVCSHGVSGVLFP